VVHRDLDRARDISGRTLEALPDRPLPVGGRLDVAQEPLDGDGAARGPVFPGTWLATRGEARGELPQRRGIPAGFQGEGKLKHATSGVADRNEFGANVSQAADFRYNEIEAMAPETRLRRGRTSVEYPSSDGKPMAESDIHRKEMTEYAI